MKMSYIAIQCSSDHRTSWTGFFNVNNLNEITNLQQCFAATKVKLIAPYYSIKNKK